MDRSSARTRKEALTTLVALPAFAAAFALGTGTAQAKASKTQFKYQNTPHGSQQCSGCSLFIPGANKTANGTCKLVDGSISPHGWCTAFAKKS